MNPYATDKVIYHPKIVNSFMCKRSHELYPMFVHLMPQNFCNQNCHFCSYRMEGWKNSQGFDARSHIPIGRLIELIHEFNSLGVKAIEITGGGEPLAHPDIVILLETLSSVEIETGLVTNGTLLKEQVADLLYATHFKWGRISIDSGCKEDYCAIRRCPESHWDMAWAGVKRLVERRNDQVIGTGFVVTEQNYKGVYDHCSRALDHGVNNVRISVAFTAQGPDLLTQEQKLEARVQLDKAAALNNDSFRVIDLFDERLTNLRLASSSQDYDYCGTKDLLCVIEGEGNVYTCCTLTGTKQGRIGNILEKTLASLWKEKQEWRNNFDPRKMCKCMCLYEKRNHVMLGLRNPPKHANFI